MSTKRPPKKKTAAKKTTRKKASTRKKSAESDRSYGDRKATKRRGKKQPESKSSARRLAAAEKRRKAVELRLQGLSYQKIADELGFKGEGPARKTVEVALAETRSLTGEAAEEIVAMELQRLDIMFKGLWLAMQAGDPRSIEAGIKVQGRRAKLLGLDAPSKHELTGKNGGPIETADVSPVDVTMFEAGELEEYTQLTQRLLELVETAEARRAAP